MCKKVNRLFKINYIQNEFLVGNPFNARLTKTE